MLMTVISIIKVMSIIRSGEHQTLDSGETLVIAENGTAPFSWMKYIVVSYVFPVIFKLPDQTDLTIRREYENGANIEISSSDLAIIRLYDPVF